MELFFGNWFSEIYEKNLTSKITLPIKLTNESFRSVIIYKQRSTKQVLSLTFVLSKVIRRYAGVMKINISQN